MSYRQVLDEAIGESPPSTIDIDAIVAKQRHRLSVQRWFGAGMAAAVAIGLVAVGLTVVPRGGSGTAVGAPRPESHSAALARLDHRLWADMAMAAPGMGWVREASVAAAYQVAGGSQFWSSGWTTPDVADVYTGQGLIKADDRVGTVSFEIGISLGSIECPSNWGNDVHLTCSANTRPDGTHTVVQQSTFTGVQPTELDIVVSVLHANGMYVTATTINHSGLARTDPDTTAAPPLTSAQLMQIALDPALTFPIVMS